MKATIIPDFQEIMGEDMMNIWNDDNWNKSESIYHINGGRIEFIGLDEPQKFHGRKQDILWINEAVEAKLKAYQQLAMRTKWRIILDYNPSYEAHWIYEKVIPRNDCAFFKSTYRCVRPMRFSIVINTK